MKSTECKILLSNTQRALRLSLPQVRKAVSLLLQMLHIETDEVSFHFVTERRICQLHKKYFNDPSPTDCITFPLDSPHPHRILGEAFICPKVAIATALQLKLNPYEELYRYIIHCLLHLIGYTDTEPKQRAKMKRKENNCLKNLLKKEALL